LPRLVYKPRPVTRFYPRRWPSLSAGCYQTAPAAYPDLRFPKEPGDEPPPCCIAAMDPAWPCSWRGLPGRRITALAGGLLHHHFTLTACPSSPLPCRERAGG